jgi:GntR family transcriptional regulator, transcriptional repressor for pyruvate dehydrogenase complex
MPAPGRRLFRTPVWASLQQSSINCPGATVCVDWSPKSLYGPPRQLFRTVAPSNLPLLQDTGETLPRAIATELRRRIASGQLKPGDRLPGHRDLAGEFSVSVGSLREAISMLVSSGHIATLAGRGTFVADGRFVEDSAAPLERTEAAELIEAREVLELQVAELAAKRASRERVATLRQCVEGLAGAVETAAAYNHADRAFHTAIAEAAGNRFLARALADIRGRLQSDLELAADAAIRRFGNLDFSVVSHAELVDAIDVGNGSAACRIALELMTRSHKFVLGLYALGPVDPV